MPELPEVETLRRGLEKAIQGCRFAGAVIANPKILKGQPEKEFRERITGTTVSQVRRRGKYLLLSLVPDPQSVIVESNPLTLCIHLKMRGQLLLDEAASPLGPYHCVSLMLAGSSREVRYHDMWTWGEVRVLTGEEMKHLVGLAGMGPEPLEPEWSGTALAEKLRGKRGPIKPLLLDQKIVAGVGNIYADESLFRAGIDPQRPAGTLTSEEADRLVQEIRAVLTEAVSGGGTTSDEYVDLAGAFGRYTPRVYDRGGQPCVACGNVLTRIKLGGRGTVYCSRCQPGTPAESWQSG